MKLGQIIEKTVENKIKSQKSQGSSSSSFNNNGTTSKLSLSEYYKTYETLQVGKHTTYDIVGQRDYSKDYKRINNLVKKEL
ncbi:hypothetical protein [Parapoynx stagnalis nucleopolyhedrovirus]|uniref:Ac55 n=1 Tax=Parapoynx stagnalis nucleopolyhedrovirus TaxID=2993413 RepID=A0A9E7YFB9_9ABAC|nr:hypothetical protein [Parapoynx stagnalis nucleopolyhedrovirus]